MEHNTMNEDAKGRIDATERNMQALFHQSAVTDQGNNPEFMRILQRFIFGEVCEVGSLDNHTRELVTITVLTVNQTLPQLKAHINACLNVKATPEEIREVIYQCAPFIGFPKTLNAIAVMDEVFDDHGIALPMEDTATVDEGNRHEVGASIQDEFYGDEIKERYAWLPGEFAPAVPEWLTSYAFGDIASRKGLETRERELLIVVILAALGGAEMQVRSHISGAIKAGNDAERIVCALAHAMPYMGFPRFFNALNAAREILETK
ncbi:carboxymuconolactone decarboxylase family protein [Bifidobacterium tsurumiense]|uniref:Carboxymuconolactone decarboxylase Related Protein n=1 Tax=Bifidobacterium tsurumiense TaxID=356829 RepID=A0A087EKQ2_9BIFI|nr:carboxymuconolactone decarboxylase family protein [Bifidobacterium tsurumiense]KFJ08353.1 carboxymuconolactone decarboxylase Related Protein [Bifidobacterium tsurumiense]MDY4678014.1 carboxymuconolactone decarboxylase family protein [Bifidobacterium tsurumiense]MSS12189.1 carboxymuconolactone decarboxylase family protein [Bifidobacterium tsurumiense]